MRLLNEKSLGNKSPSELIRDYSAQKNKEDRKKEKKAKRKQSKSYRKYQERVQDYKEKRQQWLEKQAEDNKRRREEGKTPTGGGEVISSKDTDATATKKAISNVAGVAGALFKVGGRALASRMQKKKDENKKETPNRPPISSQKLLPPGKSPVGRLQPSSGGRARKDPNFKRRQVGLRMPKSPPKTHWSHHPDIPIRPRIDNTQIPSTTPQVSLGRLARNNPEIRRRETKKRDGSVSEEYSCWREEFLYELKELRQKTKSKVTDKEPIIDIMKGKNKITMNPNVSESTETSQDKFDRRVAAAKLLKGQAKIKMLQYAASKYPKVNEELNTAAYMAKATPAITGRTKVMSDIHLSKQPGKGTAEMVRDRIRKLFLGDLKNYNPNYDFNGNTSDDNDVVSNKAIKSESYNENDETFRQHSRERFDSDSGDETRKKRTSAVLKAMAALNKDVEPKAKKKKKKKTEQ